MTRYRSADIARVCHEANRALQHLHADPGVPVAEPWDEFDPIERGCVIDGVDRALDGQGPERLHAAWCRNKEADGWTYGPVKDAAAKTHPCLVPYGELPEHQADKDALFAAIVTVLATR